MKSENRIYVYILKIKELFLLQINSYSLLCLVQIIENVLFLCLTYSSIFLYSESIIVPALLIICIPMIGEIITVSTLLLAVFLSSRPVPTIMYTVISHSIPA